MSTTSTVDNMNTTEAFSREFRFDACVGAGGQASVYRAREFTSGLRRTVAVKLMHSHRSDVDEIRRLRTEALILGDVDHTAILKVYSLSELDGRIALVTEYIEGEDLGSCIKGQEPPSPRALVEIVDLVADGLHSAYFYSGADGKQRRVIHRDIKPANIRIASNGMPKILDFGIAKSAEYTDFVAAKTATDAAIGTLVYMAPERFDKEALSPAVDVWACGAILYEGLTHQKLYAGLEPPHLYLVMMHKEPYEAHLAQAMKLLPDSTHPLLLDLVELCLSFNPKKRPTAEQLSEMCRELVGHLHQDESLRQWASRRHWPANESTDDPLIGQTLTDSALTLSRGNRLPIDDVPSKHRYGLYFGAASLVGLVATGFVALAAIGIGTVALWNNPGGDTGAAQTDGGEVANAKSEGDSETSPPEQPMDGLAAELIAGQTHRDKSPPPSEIETPPSPKTQSNTADEPLPPEPTSPSSPVEAALGTVQIDSNV
ncbi:MAG: serine/threonine protein kinase, partial [Proteobacteria bacterium]|nr:serine/threonine protein kinase [Pseudomonadota bacterium]